MESILHKERCLGYSKNNNRCRAIIKNNNKFFCCKKHEPLNNDILINGCFICMEEITDRKDIIFLKCNHMLHKPCYNDWLKYSTYGDPICMICRKVINTKKEKKTSKKHIKLLSPEQNSKIKDIENIYLKNNI